MNGELELISMKINTIMTEIKVLSYEAHRLSLEAKMLIERRYALLPDLCQVVDGLVFKTERLLNRLGRD
jgi:hypothetical protein